jgi:hypothetical protein
MHLYLQSSVLRTCLSVPCNLPAEEPFIFSSFTLLLLIVPVCWRMAGVDSVGKVSQERAVSTIRFDVVWLNVRSGYTLWMKGASQPTGGESAPQYETRLFHESTASEGRFPTYRLLMFIENSLSFHLDFSCRRCRGQIFGNSIYSITCDWGCVSRFSTKCRLELLQDVHVQSEIYLWIMHENAAPHFLHVEWKFLSEVFLEQWIGQSGPTAWPADKSPLEYIYIYIYIYGGI